MVVKTIIMILAVLAILEGLFAALAPKKIKGLLKYFTKKSNNYYRKWGIIELIIAIAVLVLAYYYL